MELIALAKNIKHRYFNPYTGPKLYRRLERLIESTPQINQLFPYEELAGHYVYEPARQTIDHPDVYINQVRYYRLYEYFKQNYPQVFSNDTAVADIGDTSGILLKAMKRKGLSVNINSDVVGYIRKKNLDAVIGDIEQLTFPDKSLDYTFSFQCLEHVNNPIKALGELARITRKNIFISIPYATKTKIYSREHWTDLKKKSFEDGGWNEQDVREVDGHKFEFSSADFAKIASHVDLKVVANYPINYFSPLGQTVKNEGSYFNFFVLKHEFTGQDSMTDLDMGKITFMGVQK